MRHVGRDNRHSLDACEIDIFWSRTVVMNIFVDLVNPIISAFLGSMQGAFYRKMSPVSGHIE
jgi:hypothetical protein